MDLSKIVHTAAFLKPQVQNVKYNEQSGDHFMMGILNYLSEEIFPVIVNDLQSRGIEISIEELITMMMEPKSDLNTDKCIYQYKRGENKGQLCGKPVTEGMSYCSNCIKTRKNLGMDQQNLTDEQIDRGERGNSLTVVVHDESRHLYRDPNTNFIIYQTQCRAPTVIGRLCNDKIIPLTESEFNIASELGLLICNLTSESSESHITQKATPILIPKQVRNVNPPQMEPEVPITSIPAIPSMPRSYSVKNN
jgi:hypothetical protein